jgi:hypothetical protein
MTAASRTSLPVNRSTTAGQEGQSAAATGIVTAPRTAARGLVHATWIPDVNRPVTIVLPCGPVNLEHGQALDLWSVLAEVLAGCPWCGLPVVLAACEDPAGHERYHRASETTWRRAAATPGRWTP